MAAWLGVSLLATTAAAQPAVDGYRDSGAFVRQLKQLDRSERASLRSLATTAGGREIYLLTLSEGEAEDKPALLILGGTSAVEQAGSEVVLRLAQQLVEQAATSEAVGQLLARYTLYLIPQPSPDASAHFVQRPLVERASNARPRDDDRDGATDEDPPEDLNGDGLVTMIRVEDPAGPWMPHPTEPRVLIKADPQQGEAGKYQLYREGTDNDGDGQFNEDGPGGVQFNRNFPYAYPYFEAGAGPHQVSEPETRAVADFAFEHPNIAAVLTLGEQENLTHPWQPNKSASRYEPAIAEADAPYLEFLAKKFQDLEPSTSAGQSPKAAGDVLHWAWFHYGRWSFGAPVWAVPDVKPAAEQSGEKKQEADAAEKDDAAERGADELRALRWFAEQQIDGFVDWTPIEHPDFPGQRVEVGGFRPYVRQNPPAEQLDALAARQREFLLAVAEHLPRLRIHEVQVEPLGGGLFRVTASVLNDGYLPTFSQAGTDSRVTYPVQLQIELPPGARLVSGNERTRLPTLSGRGGHAERSWVVLLEKPDKAAEVQVRAFSPSVGSDSKRVKLQ